ncbi:MAG: hypothetical protein COZ18_14580 [Flexibacter sp. CG_4_10_14_3_um_filter_32_15]|nr:MAG: hypothetical protein COZ18_14580 [Flexibacter sp. CG_4_10_14_3_um_filter_32_15]
MLKPKRTIDGIIALGTGFLGMTTSFDATTNPMQDNNHRYVAAIWASTSLAFFYVAWYPSEIALFRFLMIALFIGGIVRAIALINYRPTPVIIFGILLELIPNTLMLWMHTKLINEGSL